MHARALVPSESREKLVFWIFTVNDVHDWRRVLPARNLLLLEQDSDIRLSNYSRWLRFVRIKNTALWMDNLKNISVLSSAAYVTKLKRFSSVTLYRLHRIPKIQSVNENVSRLVSRVQPCHPALNPLTRARRIKSLFKSVYSRSKKSSSLFSYTRFRLYVRVLESTMVRLSRTFGWTFRQRSAERVTRQNDIF